jgi:hypothetical protein
MPFDTGDWSWPPDGGLPSPRRHTRAPEAIRRYTVKHRLTRTEAERPEIVDRVRDKLVDEVYRWCNGNGYSPNEASWESTMDGAFDTVTLLLTVKLTPRTDGEWPAIRAAIAEDEADRKTAAAIQTSVDDRLDALGASAAVWAATTPSEVREALRKPLKRSDR